MGTLGLITLTVATVALLLALILLVRLPAFLALLVCSLFAALAGGLPPSQIAATLQDAMGRTLGYIAVVIGVGAIFGELLQRSGGAATIAGTLLRAFGERRVPWALGLAGLLVAIPVFFDVAFILFVPLIYGLARASERSHLELAFPLLAGLAVAHAFIPPTPGPVAVAGILGADLGWVIAFGLASGFPALVVGGLLFGGFAARRLAHVPAAEAAASETPDPAAAPGRPPSFGLAMSLLALPLVLILSATISKVRLPEGDRVRDLLQLVGHPFTALILATLLAYYFLGLRRGFSRAQLQTTTTRALEPVAVIILITGAGGVLGKTLVAIGVGEAVSRTVAGSGLPLVVLAFALAAAVRVAQGSATVSMVTAAGLVAPLLEARDVSDPDAAAMVVAIAAGATVLSHVNDSGFWLVSRYLGLSEQETLRSWTVLTTVVGVTGFAVALCLSRVL